MDTISPGATCLPKAAASTIPPVQIVGGPNITQKGIRMAVEDDELFNVTKPSEIPWPWAVLVKFTFNVVVAAPASVMVALSVATCAVGFVTLGVAGNVNGSPA